MPHLVGDHRVVVAALHVVKHVLVALLLLGRRLARRGRKLPGQDVRQPRQRRRLRRRVDQAGTARRERVLAQLVETIGDEGVVERERGDRIGDRPRHRRARGQARELQDRRVDELPLDVAAAGARQRRRELRRARRGDVVPALGVERGGLARRQHRLHLGRRRPRRQRIECLAIEAGDAREAPADLILAELGQPAGRAEPGRARPVVDVAAVRDLVGSDLAVHVTDHVDELLRGEIGGGGPDVDRRRNLLAGQRIVGVGHDPPVAGQLGIGDVEDGVVADVAGARGEPDAAAFLVIAGIDGVVAENDHGRHRCDRSDRERARVFPAAPFGGDRGRLLRGEIGAGLGVPPVRAAAAVDVARDPHRLVVIVLLPLPHRELLVAIRAAARRPPGLPAFDEPRDLHRALERQVPLDRRPVRRFEEARVAGDVPGNGPGHLWVKTSHRDPAPAPSHSSAVPLPSSSRFGSAFGSPVGSSVVASVAQAIGPRCAGSALVGSA